MTAFPLMAISIRRESLHDPALPRRFPASVFDASG
jgi:hypothetical protein